MSARQVLIDLHVHYRVRARRPQAPEPMCQAAMDAGLDGIVFTEHHEQLTADSVNHLRERFAPLRIYSGQEVSCGEDMLVIGSGLPPELPRDYPSLRQIANSQHWVLIWAHPFRRKAWPQVDFSAALPDAIELRSRNIALHTLPLICQWNSQHLLPATTGSDAHKPQHIGRWSTTFFEAPADERRLADLIRAGQFRPEVL